MAELPAKRATIITQHLIAIDVAVPRRLSSSIGYIAEAVPLPASRFNQP